MLAPGVVVDSVTLCALVYVPAAGLKVAAATGTDAVPVAKFQAYSLEMVFPARSATPVVIATA